MKVNSSHLVGAAIALAAVFFSKLDAQDAPNKAEPQKWEYDFHVKYTGPEGIGEEWEDMGSDGWELVAVTTRQVQLRGVPTLAYEGFFKRPKQ